jgi:hypothetical protein
MSRGSRLLALARLLRGIPQPRVDREEAIAKATDEMRRHEWEREPDAPVIEDLKEWVVYGVDGPPCGNIVVYVDMQDGRVRTYTRAGRLGDDAASSGPHDN